MLHTLFLFCFRARHDSYACDCSAPPPLSLTHSGRLGPSVLVTAVAVQSNHTHTNHCEGLSARTSVRLSIHSATDFDSKTVDGLQTLNNHNWWFSVPCCTIVKNRIQFILGWSKSGTMTKPDAVLPVQTPVSIPFAHGQGLEHLDSSLNDSRARPVKETGINQPEGTAPKEESRLV
jgi:hypothetical protein